MSPTLEGVSLSGDHKSGRGRRGRDSMVVGFTTTYAISAYHTDVVSSNPVHGEVYSIQHYVISLTVTCDRSEVLSGYTSFLHQ